MSRKILIVSHKFPPAPGIGGRRWAKFAKYLSRAGNDVFILTSESVEHGNSSWTKDVEGLNVEQLPAKYPQSVILPISGLLDKLRYHLAIQTLKYRDKGNYYDRSIFWEKQISQRVSWYIDNKKIDTVIATGGPFRLVYYTTKLKTKYPGVTFVSDFRDYWTEDSEVSAMQHMSKRRKEVERSYEKATVNNSDLVLTVSERMKDFFSSLSQNKNCVVIPNGYDPEDIVGPRAYVTQQTAEKKVRFIFAGTLYSNLEYILIPFFDAIKKLKQEQPNLYGYLSIEFYGKFPTYYKTHIDENDIATTVLVKGERPYEDVAMKLREAHFGLLFLNDSYNFSFSTKFCEYVALRKKIMVISKDGDTAAYITKNNLGFHIDPAQSYEGIEKVITQVKENNFRVEVNDHFDETIFSVKRISKDLASALNNSSSIKYN